MAVSNDAEQELYGIFWVQTQPCTPELLNYVLEKSTATDHTVCAYMT